MTAFNGNAAYLVIGGVVINTEWKEYSFDATAETVETTRGVGATHTMRNAGLRDTSLTITVGYEIEKIQQQIGYMRPGTRATIIVGPEGNASGKPRHEQDFILTGAPFEQTVEKDEVVFQLAFEAADAPVADMFNGSVFA